MATQDGSTPNVSQFLNAANWEYSQSGGLPADLTPFLVNGQQLAYSNSTDGIQANAWLTPNGQVIAAYQGTQFVSATNFAANPTESFSQVVEDVGVADGQVTAGEVDAADFARQVTAAAGAQGISPSNVFLTGHSLGGIQAEYAAQQTGLGGVAFESTGIPRSSTTTGDGTNFVNVVTYGDSVGNYSSDINAEQPFAPAYAPGGTGALPHYGYVAMIGSPSDQVALQTEAQASAAGAPGVGLTAAAYGAQLAAFHLPGVQAHDLGVTLTQQPLGDQVGVQTAPVINAANFTIPQLLQATGAALSAPLPPDPAISATSGAYAGQAATTISQGIALAELANPVCFGEGTQILCEGDDGLTTTVAIEALRVGDKVVTSSGEHRAIRWVGHRRIDCRRHPNPENVLPVRVAAHAFGPQRPARDLTLSPGHSICVDLLGEVLVSASSLINGSTIVQVDVDAVTYWHLELDAHDIVFAENLPCESYLEMGNREFFATQDVVALGGEPDVRVVTHDDFCRPFQAHGPVVTFALSRLADRAREMGWTRRDDTFADLALVVDGHRIEPQIRGKSARFLLPTSAREVWLTSRSAVPAHVGAGSDRRSLGACVAQLVIEDGFGAPQIVSASDPSLCVGFHAAEAGPQRWTTGRARLPSALWSEAAGDSVFLRVDLAHPALPHWVAPQAARLSVAV